MMYRLDDPEFQDGCRVYDVVFFLATVRRMRDGPRAMRFASRIARSVLWFETNRIRPVFPLEKYERLLYENTDFRHVEKIPPGYERGYRMYRCSR
jgi:hypothetical protein